MVSEGKVDFKSVAERLRTVIPVPEEDGVVEPDAFVPILEALEELKSVNLVTHPQFSTEIEKTKIIDMLFAILDKNRPNTEQSSQSYLRHVGVTRRADFGTPDLVQPILPKGNRKGGAEVTNGGDAFTAGVAFD